MMTSVDNGDIHGDDNDDDDNNRGQGSTPPAARFSSCPLARNYPTVAAISRGKSSLPSREDDDERNGRNTLFSLLGGRMGCITLLANAFVKRRA